MIMCFTPTDVTVTCPGKSGHGSLLLPDNCGEKVGEFYMSYSITYNILNIVSRALHKLKFVQCQFTAQADIFKNDICFKLFCCFLPHVKRCNYRQGVEQLFFSQRYGILQYAKKIEMEWNSKMYENNCQIGDETSAHTFF